MAKFSFQPRTFPIDLSNGEIIPVEDPLESEHWLFVVNHPAFPDDLAKLNEERQHVFPEHDLEQLQRSMLENPRFNWPLLQELADKWGLPPSALVAFADIPPSRMSELRPEAVEEFRQEAHGLVVVETEEEFVVRIPRPWTNAKKATLENWLGSPARDGPRERAWRRVGKTKESPSPKLVRAIPWFLRWNSGEEDPIDIWRDLIRPGGEFTPQEIRSDVFAEQIHGVWERMRMFSIKKIRSRPSKRGT